MEIKKTASEQVVLPRVIEVREYANARAAEIAALSAALMESGTLGPEARAPEAEGGRGGGPQGAPIAIARHLRRRTTSHNRRKVLFGPMKEKSKKKQRAEENAVKQATTPGDAGGAALPQGSRADVEVRAQASPLDNEVGGSREGAPDSSLRPEGKDLSRRLRRRFELKGRRTVTGSGDVRLETHVWHAKRFEMARRWGYCLAEGLPGRGLGSRAVLRWAEEAAVLHDASYLGAIQLRGTEIAVRRLLARVSDAMSAPAVLVGSLGPPLAAGACAGAFMLHSPRSFPRGAICPASFLWRPGAVAQEGTPPTANSVGGSKHDTRQRDMLIWVHPAAYDDAVAALAGANAPSSEDSTAVTVSTRVGELAVLELLGTGSTSVLERVLQPALGRRGPAWDLLRANDQLPDGAVLSLCVTDPREVWQRRDSAGLSDLVASQELSSGARHVAALGSRPGGKAMGPALASHHPGDPAAPERGGDLEQPWDKKRARQACAAWRSSIGAGQVATYAASDALWEPPRDGRGRPVVPLPETEHSRSERRRQARLAAFRGVDAAGSFAAGCQRAPSAEALAVQGGAQSSDLSRTCPVLLIRRRQAHASTCGWRLVVPAGWVREFWVPLVMAGGHVIGLRERRWLATEAGELSFPYDFPDCPAYNRHQEAECAAQREEYNSKPASKRPPAPPRPPDWRTIVPCGSATTMEQPSGAAAGGEPGPVSAQEGPDGEPAPLSAGTPPSNSGEAMSTIGQLLQSGDRGRAAEEEPPAGADPRQSMPECQQNSEREIRPEAGPTGSRQEPANGLPGGAKAHAHPTEEPRAASRAPGGAEVQTCDIYVARSPANLEAALAPPQRGSAPRGTGAGGMLTGGTTVWQAAGEGLLQWRPAPRQKGRETLSSWKRHGSGAVAAPGCFTCVHVILPRKGVAEEGAQICAPLPPDVDSWRHGAKLKWQGVQTDGSRAEPAAPKALTKKQQKKEMLRRERGAAASSVMAPGRELDAAAASLPGAREEGPPGERRVIGFVTSPAPRGSSRGAAIGFVRAAELLRLKVHQDSGQQGNWSENILALLCSGGSRMLRPALLSPVGGEMSRP